ncbi:uncharacterized protein RCC_02370 [Ramularia collo-cygni]|uniref:Cell wall protein n=1 Tax=Ramularia collo-cygni TaxID=112498 RepID=A0A2D3UZ80_9PEZI|nr:uncharacterized protein RCC_02370 [Ramularia collo-cygni]CZT16536.1 uncharacterized protein RCC_02370 [Ramularia collo-cygni]
MLFPTALLSVILATTILALPVPQLAGEGAACNSIFSSTDNAIGFGIKNAEDKIASHISDITHLAPRQLAGEGAACDSIFSSTDNAIGFGVKNAEDKLAGNITSVKEGITSMVKRVFDSLNRRQLDKIANGFQDITDAAGVGFTTTPLTGALDGLDGTTTSIPANIGASIGDAEENILEGLGNAVP